MEKHYKIGEVAEMLGIHEDTLRKWDKQGIIVADRMGTRKDRRYTVEQIRKIKDIGLVSDLVRRKPSKVDYSEYSKVQLIKELQILKKQKKYGLVWEEKAEDVVERCKKEAPILKPVPEMNVSGKKEEQRHIIIEGDNYHALQVLNYTHKGKIDVIYIDPPYNTGNDGWKYNDKIVDGADEYRHSKWLSMMEKRLKLAKNLLSEKGVIFISIDDNEQANLKLLCDEIFGNKNFVNTLIWQRASGGGNAGDIVTGHDYILIYLKKEKHKFFGLESSRGKTINHKGVELRVDDDVVRKVFGKYKKGVERRCYYEELEKYKNQKQIDEIKNKIQTGEYILLEQKNKKHFIAKIVKDGQKKVLYSIVQGILNNEGNNEMIDLDLEFENPKPKKLLKLLIDSTNTKNDQVILDFFAGSGTTGHAVLELNKKDKGNRQFILCTNNENKIAEEITRERIKKVMKGYKKNGTREEVEGLGGNLEYLKTEFIDVDNIGNISDKKRLAFTHEAGYVIALKENTFEEEVKNKWYQIFSDNKGKYVGIYFREDLSKLEELEQKILGKEKVKLYIFSHGGSSDWENDYSEYENVKVEDIPEPILKVYKSLNS